MCSAAQPVDRRPSRSASRATASGSRPASVLGELADRRAVRLHADRVDHARRARDRPVSSRTASADRRRARRGRASRRRASRGPLEPLGHEVDADAPGRRRGAGRCGMHISPIGPRPSTSDACRPSGHVRVLDGLPGGRQHVGEVDEAVVGRALGDLDRPVLGLRHAQAARPGRPGPGRTAWCSRTARRRCRARAPGSSRTATAGPWSHMQQCPQEMLNGITTRSPGLMCVTSAPTSSTMPIGSWPRMSPGSMNGPSTS